MRHALRTRFRDSTARFLSLTPSFRQKGRKMPAKLLFRPRRSRCSPAQLFFARLLIVFEGRIFRRRTTRVSVTLASSSHERTSEILSFLSALRNYMPFLQPHVAPRRFRDPLSGQALCSTFLPVFFLSLIYRHNNANKYIRERKFKILFNFILS